MWGQRTYDPAHALLRLGPMPMRVRAENKWGEAEVSRGQSRTTLSSALQNFRGKSSISMKAAPKKPPEGSASRVGPTWGYGAKLVQGEYVPSALNTPTSVLTMLMRKDACTG